MISKGRKSTEYIDIGNIREADIASLYLGITSIPCLIHSPLRKDSKPSFGIYSLDGNSIGYIDFSTKERGNIINLLCKMWSCSYIEVLERIKRDFEIKDTKGTKVGKIKNNKVTVNKLSGIDIKCKVREWKKHDVDYWKSYGISIKWLKYADVYPISHKIIIKDNISYVFGADKYAYAYVEFKEGKTTLKIYQPYNKNGFKWANRHDRSVISLWTKVPSYGEKVCICSSLKDALCLWANTGIPALAVQGEGYSISNTAIRELKRRFNKIYICFDNDKAGLEDAEKLSEATGFTNIVLPKINEAKDISDVYKTMENKEQFKELMLNLFKLN